MMVPLVTQWCVKDVRQHWLRSWIDACSVKTIIRKNDNSWEQISMKILSWLGYFQSRSYALTYLGTQRHHQYCRVGAPSTGVRGGCNAGYGGWAWWLGLLLASNWLPTVRCGAACGRWGASELQGRVTGVTRGLRPDRCMRWEGSGGEAEPR